MSIKYFTWYRREEDKFTQYFVLTSLDDRWKKEGYKLSYTMFSLTDNLYNIESPGFAIFNRSVLEKGSKYTKAGDYEELYDFEQDIAWNVLGQKFGTNIIKKLFGE